MWKRCQCRYNPKVAASASLEYPASAPVLSPPRLPWVDAIRACAILMVVATHVVTTIQQRSFANAGHWWTTLLAHVLVRPCVPLFVMLSGTLLLDPSRSEPIPVFLRKRFSRVLIPYLFWTSVYLALHQLAGNHPLTVSGMLWSVVETPVSGHLWFVQMILGVYLATPVLRIFVRGASRSDLYFFCLIWGIWVLMNACQTMADVNLHIKPYVATSYVGYFVLGYLLRDVAVDGRRKWLLAAFVAAFAFTAVASHIVMARAGGKTSLRFLDNLNPNLIVLSAAIFLLLRDIPYARLYGRVSWLDAAVRSLSGAAYSIYLAHVLVLIALGRYRLDGLVTHPVLGIPIVVGVTTALTWVLVMVMRRAPYLRMAVSG
ncbi:MAG: acyltransferase [Bryobacterales bacterium]|nr:acyltransferase [Bryobacterales bacterium]